MAESTFTPNLNLELPDPSQEIDVDKINANMGKIDTAMYDTFHDTGIATANAGWSIDTQGGMKLGALGVVFVTVKYTASTTITVSSQGVISPSLTPFNLTADYNPWNTPSGRRYPVNALGTADSASRIWGSNMDGAGAVYVVSGVPGLQLLKNNLISFYIVYPLGAGT